MFLKHRDKKIHSLGILRHTELLHLTTHSTEVSVVGLSGRQQKDRAQAEMQFPHYVPLLLSLNMAHFYTTWRF